MGHKHSKTNLLSQCMPRRHSCNEPYSKTTPKKHLKRAETESSLAEDQISEFIVSKHKLIPTNRVYHTRAVHMMPGSSLNHETERHTSDPETDRELVQKLPEVFNRLKNPLILHYIDNRRNQLCVYDTKTQQWTKNNLNIAHCEHYNYELSSSGEAVFRNQILASLQDSTLVPIDNDTFHIIGRLHLEYSVSKNSFKFLDEQETKLHDPTVCYGAGSIFLLSGEQNNEYVSSCVRYDILDKVWVPMPDLPSAHVNGTAICCLDPEKKGAYKIIVVGGFSSRIPTLFNLNMSVFDSETNQWEIIPLEKFCPKPPKFIRAPIVQSHEDKVLLIQDDNGLAFYEIDLKDWSFGEVKKLSFPEDLNMPRRVSYCLDEKDDVLFLTKYDSHACPDIRENLSLKTTKTSDYSIVRVNLPAQN